MNRNNSIWMFLIGLGAATKVYLGGIIALSELIVFAVAPLILYRHYLDYKRGGIIPILCLSLAMVPGCFISCLCNKVHWLWFIKSSMQFYSIFAMVVVFYFLLHKRLEGIGWFYIGLFISTIISVFFLNPHLVASERSTELIGQIGVEEQLEGVLFWYPKIGQILRLPVVGWYFRTPMVYTLSAPLAFAAVAIFISVSGRGGAAMALLSSVLIAYCQRSRKRMRSIGRHFVIFIIASVVSALCIKNLYVYSAKSGLLGYEAQAKYYVQTRGDSSFMRVLIGGRTEFFIALRAMIDNPIIGIGPRAEDVKGYVKEFLLKYGKQEDFDYYIRRRMNSPDTAELIPQHSTFTQFWGHAGISGLIFCLYFLYLVYVYFRRYAPCVPQWFGYFALMIPPALFSLFFNPYSERVTFPLLITCLLIVRAVGKGKLKLPYEMDEEAGKYDMR